MRKMRGLLAFLLTLILLGSSIPMPVHAATETATFIMDYLTITQGINGSYSHKGTYAIDLAGKDSGRDVVYAPFTGVVKMLYTKSGNFVWLESKNKVQYADGTVDYMTIMIGHDNNISDLSVGMTIPQGTVFYQEGTAGNATGNHVHLEVARGKFRTGGWYENEYGIWELYNAIPPYDALVLKSSTIRKQDYNYNWRTVGGGSSAPTPTFSVKTTTNCDYRVSVPSGYKLVCYDSVTSTTPSSHYIAAQSSGYTLYCTTMYTMSDGTTRFKFVSGDGYTLYFVLQSLSYTAKHKYSTVSNTATCTVGGILTSQCSSCGHTTTEASQPTGHFWYGSTVTKQPTAKEEGVLTYFCLCGGTKTESIPPAVQRGDVDEDGAITSTDARLTLQFYAGKIKESDLNTAMADVDKDGTITSTDGRLILQYYAGKITDFPAK